MRGLIRALSAVEDSIWGDALGAVILMLFFWLCLFGAALFGGVPS